MIKPLSRRLSCLYKPPLNGVGLWRWSSSSGNTKAVDLNYHLYKPKAKEATGLPLFLLHGVFGNFRNLAGVATRVAASANVKAISVDLRNHGDSPHCDTMSYEEMAADVAKLAQSLGYPKFDLMGHSMGGKVAMTLALTQPELIGSLIVEDIYPGMRKSALSLLGNASQMKSFKFPSISSLSEVRKLAMSHLESAEPEISIRSFLVQNLVSDGDSFKWRLNLNSLEKEFHTLAGFPDISSNFPRKSLFINGGKSNVVGQEELKCIRTYFPGATILKVLEAGHWIHSEKAEEFCQLVSQFITNKSGPVPNVVPHQ